MKQPDLPSTDLKLPRLASTPVEDRKEDLGRFKTCESNSSASSRNNPPFMHKLGSDILLFEESSLGLARATPSRPASKKPEESLHRTNARMRLYRYSPE